MPHIDLLELPYFTGIPIDAVVSLIDAMAPCAFASGETIFLQGAPDIPPLLIATVGRIGIVKRREPGTAPDAEHMVAQLQAPTVLGEVELFCRTPAVATARALTAVQAFALSPATFERLFAAGHPGLLRFVLNMAKVACLRLVATDALLCTLMADADVSAVRQRLLAQPLLQENSPPR
jgi:CRP-like cAMP-binding protein